MRNERITKYFPPLTERPLRDNNKLVSYFKFSGSSILNPSESTTDHQNADVAPANMPTNESVSQKLRDLQALRKDGVITEEEFQKKKKELLNQF